MQHSCKIINLNANATILHLINYAYSYSFMARTITWNQALLKVGHHM